MLRRGLANSGGKGQKMTTTDYQKQATDFLSRFGLTFKASGGTTECPPWSSDDKRPGGACPDCGDFHGLRYLVTITGDKRRISFPFWNSAHAAAKKLPLTAYDALSCVSSDVHCPDTFEDFCGEYGYDADSRKALRLFKRCREFADRLTAFFTAEELEALAEIS